MLLLELHALAMYWPLEQTLQVDGAVTPWLQ